LIYVDVGEDMHRDALDQLGVLFEDDQDADIGVKRGGQEGDCGGVALFGSPGSGDSSPVIPGAGHGRARQDSNLQPLDP
jgi:hypothetical protein